MNKERFYVNLHNGKVSMPNSQPLPTRLRNGAVAVVLGDQNALSVLDEERSLSSDLAKNDEVIVSGEPAIGAGKRWWRVCKRGESNFVWAVECDRDRYYLAPLQHIFTR